MLSIVQSPQDANVIDVYTVAAIAIIIPAVASAALAPASLYFFAPADERQRATIAIGRAITDAHPAKAKGKMPKISAVRLRQNPVIERPFTV